MPISGISYLNGLTWKAPVTTSANLPTVGNVAGDSRAAIDTGTVYTWSGSAWQAPSGGGGGISGAGTAGQLTYWSGTSAVTGSTLLTWDNVNTLMTMGALSYTASNSMINMGITTVGNEQIILQNRSNNATSSASMVVNNDISTDSTTFGEIGINSSTYTGSGSYNLANATYLSSTGGDLAIGTSGSNLIRFFVNSGATDAMAISSSGLIGIATSAPTHALTLGSTATGISLYNTSDQTTNYERVRKAWSSNIFQITSEVGGTGTVRSIQLVGGTRILSINPTMSVGAGVFDANVATSSLTGTILSVQGTYNGTNTAQNGVGIFPTVNQSSTAGFGALYISPYLQTTGTGGTYLINAGTNTAASNGGTHTPVFVVSSAGNINTASSATLGHTFYNTSDQVTNYEGYRMTFISNVFGIYPIYGGTGASRPIFIGNSAQTSGIKIDPAQNAKITFAAGSAGGTADLVVIPFTSTLSASNGNQYFASIVPTVNQTSTAGYSTLYISPYQQATASGGNYLINAGTNTAGGGLGTHTPLFQVDNNGTVFGTGSYTATASNTTVSLKPRAAFTSAGTGVGLSTGVTYSVTSGQVYAVSITPTYNEASATTSNTDLLINRTQTAVGSGTQLLIDTQVGGVSKFAVSTTGKVGLGGSAPGSTMLFAQLSSASDRGIIVRGAASQSAEIFQAQDSSTAELISIRSDGKINFISANTATTVGAAGAASALPATPVGYLQITIAGTTYKLPYYNN
jgi:hypothetical protein